jgi:low temperature requirement protein LtrA
MAELSEAFKARLKDDLWHRLRPMGGNDPVQQHRAATPLELLYDLVYVVAFGAAAGQLAHYIAEGAAGPAFGAYLFAIFGVSWAWMNFTWFSSAYGNDDALFRVATIVQMVGAVIFVFGLPVSFEAAVHGESPNNVLLVVGYIIMRVPLIGLWLRAAREDPAHRRTAVAYAVTIAIAQFGWLLTIVLPLSALVTVLAIIALAVAEMVAPVVISVRLGRAPWHPGHIAERFALLTLIALGEVVASTTIAVGALIEAEGWSLAAVSIAVAGVVLVASLWWAYFLIPSRTLLERWPARIWAWRYAHLPMFGAIAAVGAGLHVAAYSVEAHHHIEPIVVALALAIPVAAVILVVYATWSLLVRSFDWAHVPMLLVCLLPLVAAVIVAALAPDGEGGGAWVLTVVIGLVALSAIVEVIVHERVGYRHTIAALERGNVSQRSAVD